YFGDSALRGRLKTLRTEIDQQIGVLQKRTAVHLPSVDVTVAAVVATEQADMQVPVEILTLAQAYLLTQTCIEDMGQKSSAVTCLDCNEKVNGLQQRTVYSRVKNIHKFASEGNIQAIVDGAKVALTATSCAFIREQAQAVAEDPTVSLMLSTKNRTYIHGREEMPCFASLMTVFKSCLAQGIPILLKVKKAAHTVEQKPENYDVRLLLQPKNGAFQAVKLTEADKKAPLFVLEAQRCGKAIAEESAETYQQRLMHSKFMTLMRLNAAAHKQYSDATLQVPTLVEESADKDSLVSKEFSALQEAAKKHGCCFENQTLLRITHAFCDTFEAQKMTLTGGN
ncbi:MAG TPA: hypothetical protein VN457_04200, partial [Chlamydiales bacterium]|nr:hypothetical protein [Chlamydiales bacterium]